MTKSEAQQLLTEYIDNPALRRHCEMVAQAMEAYATKLGENSEDWYIAGLLHDLDWEKYPDEHPNKACDEILPAHGISDEILDAIRAHAPARTGKQPETNIEKYLFACDEISGFMDAVAKVHPGRFEGMKWSSVKKKLKNKDVRGRCSSGRYRKWRQTYWRSTE
ncbi:HD domain-containing protein [Candidatus Woesebacteria bacterium]|nr:HD domain-containing protein [Candidatus Woesebacteria bacterium]